MASDVTLTLTGDEALVLFEWLRRFHATTTQAFEDQAEQRALWNLEAYLEQALVEPFTPDYDHLLAAARARLRDARE